MKIRVLIADDHRLFRESLLLLIAQEQDMQLAGTARDGREAVQMALDLRPDVVIMDISMPTSNGFDATRAITDSCPATKVLILTMHKDPEFRNEAGHAGAAAYLQKHDLTDLATAIRQVNDGMQLLSWSRDARSTCCELTGRQREVLQLIADGNTLREIGLSLNISPRVVQLHVYRLYHRLGVSSTFELINRAMQDGLVSKSSLALANSDNAPDGSCS